MNAEPFSRPGALDLSNLNAGAPSTGSGASYCVDLTEANFQQVATQSTRVGVVVVLISGKDPASASTAEAVRSVINQMEGRLLCGIADIDTEPRLAQAFGVQAVPTCVALIAGQLAPLFQGTKDAAELKALFDQVHQLAVANGITGRAEPQASAAPQADGEAEQSVDPRFAAADAALQRGDFAGAVTEFDALIKANPGDQEAIAGRAQASLLDRTKDVDPTVFDEADAKPEDLTAQMLAADVELLGGEPARAFDRLLHLIRTTTDEDREKVRLRLVELFSTCNPADPAVKKARRDLAMALF